MARSSEPLRAWAKDRTAELAAGEPLDPLTAALVDVGLSASVAALDELGLEQAIGAARMAGATTAQIEETVALVSGLGVHSLMLAAPLLFRDAHRRGEPGMTGPLDAERQATWDRLIGNDGYWRTFEEELPGFLEALLRLSPATFRSFLDYCAVPWHGGQVAARTKELVSMAVDAAPGHRFGPGFRLHLRNAVKLGAGRRAIFEALDRAERSPPFSGIA